MAGFSSFQVDSGRFTELEDYLPLLFHTATRSDETRAMRWSDLDFERALWTIPPEASKTGEITGEPHIVPLSAGTLEVLRRRRGRKVAPLSTYVLPAASGGYMRHPSRGIATVRKRSGSWTSRSTTSAGPSRNGSPRSSGKA